MTFTCFQIDYQKQKLKKGKDRKKSCRKIPKTKIENAYRQHAK